MFPFFDSKQQTQMIRRSKKPLDFFIKVDRIWKKDDPQAVLKAKREYMGGFVIRGDFSTKMNPSFTFL